MSAYSNQPFALQDGDFFGNLWSDIQEVGSGIIDQTGEKAEETGKGIIDNWLNYGQQEFGGMLSPGGNSTTEQPINYNPNPNPANTNTGVPKPTPDNNATNVSTSFVKNPLVLGGAGLGIAKLAGLNWAYSLGIGAATYFIAPKLLENVNI